MKMILSGLAALLAREILPAPRLDNAPKGVCEPVRPPEVEAGRNAPCPCGSGKKFKKCHLGRGGNSIAA